jgi:hypothetical protein
MSPSKEKHKISMSACSLKPLVLNGQMEQALITYVPHVVSKVSIIENNRWKVPIGYSCCAVGTRQHDLCTKWKLLLQIVTDFWD